jgi:hypothetical protein
MVLLHTNGNNESHLASLDLDELHEFAEQLPAEYIKFVDAPKPNIPHYEFKSYGVLLLARQIGAIGVNGWDMAQFTKEYNKHRED